ncbi:MAG: hypothetical protein L6420_02530 [Elusimicrobia bacterium]|nr:hypothetical protein [Elusimicrobiota bacterium]
MRDVNTVKGLHGSKTMLSTKKRSIPRVQSSAYLDLYMLGKEKERLLKEGERVSLRGTLIEKRLKEVDSEMGKLQEAEAIAKSSANTNSSYPQGNSVKKEWKKMPLSY